MLTKSMTFAEVCSRLNRSPVYVRGLQRRFALPILEGAAYSASYVAFLEGIIHLRVLGIQEDTLTHIWNLERKLMQLLHADSTGSATWFLDACGSAGKRDHRLLLSNFDIGTFLPSGAVQLGLNFSDTDKLELFTKAEMGEDAILVVRQYLPLHQQILRDVRLEVPVIRAAIRRYRSPQRIMSKRTPAKPRGTSLVSGEI